VGDVPPGDIRVPIGQAKVVRSGADLTIVSASYLTVEALQAAKALAKEGVECEIVDLRTLSPIDWPTIGNSIDKTKRLLALDSGAQTGSFAGEIIARAAMQYHDDLLAAPRRLAMPDVPEPTSFGLTRGFYVRSSNIFQEAMNMLGKPSNSGVNPLVEPTPHDVPGTWFKGPF
jgi:pyruvate dehydrogenase E1 component beta subunit